MRWLLAVGFALLAVAVLSWLPEFADPLIDGVLLSASLLGLVLAAVHWRAAGLALAFPAWIWFGTRFGGIDSVVAMTIALGFVLALAGEVKRSTPLFVGGMIVAGTVQMVWIFSNSAVDNPYLLGNVLFTPGAWLAAVGAWRGAPWVHATPAPETVK